MRKHAALVIGLVALSLWTPPAQAGLWSAPQCPMYVGTFNTGEAGLTVTIVQENDQDVAPRTEPLANPPGGKDADATVKRGRVQFNAHVDKESGRLFIHWESVRENP